MMIAIGDRRDAALHARDRRSFCNRAIGGATLSMRISGIPLWGLVAAAALYFGVAAAAVEFAWDRSINALAEIGAHRLDLYAASLKSELGRYEMMPSIVARQESVRALLGAMPDPAAGLLQTVNTYLDAVNHEAGSVAVDVIDQHGLVIAASNWNRPESFVGTNVSYRPYFQDASRAWLGSLFRHRYQHRHAWPLFRERGAG